MRYLSTVLLSSFFMLTACGGDSDTNNNDELPDNNTQTGMFIDSPIINIGYRTDSFEGVTNDQGQFQYKSGEKITFFIGELNFPDAEADSILTPMNLFDALNPEDEPVTHVLQLLQTLDKDGDPSNGITITETAKENAYAVNFNDTEEGFAQNVQNLILNAGQEKPTTELVDVDIALEHFKEQIEKYQVDFG